MTARSVIETRAPFGGICDVESAKIVARKLFESYDKDRNGQLDHSEGKFKYYLKLPL